jgi:hypothetical protein
LLSLVPFAVSPHESMQLILYRAIYDHDLEQLQQLVSSWASNERAERRVLIALDHIFSSEPMLRSTDPAEVLEMLRQFFLYDHLAKRLSTKNPQGVTSTVKVLFAVRVNTSFKFDLTPGTFVHKWAKEHTLPGARSSRRSSSTTHLSKTELEEQIATAVRSRLIHRVQGLNAECERLYSLSPLDHEEPNALRNWQERSLSLAGLHLDIVDLVGASTTQSVRADSICSYLLVNRSILSKTSMRAQGRVFTEYPYSAPGSAASSI